MKQVIIDITVLVMNVSVWEAENWKEIPEREGLYYFWNFVCGGIVVIISENGEKPGATSSVIFERHLKAFDDGKRNRIIGQCRISA